MRAKTNCVMSIEHGKSDDLVMGSCRGAVWTASEINRARRVTRNVLPGWGRGVWRARNIGPSRLSENLSRFWTITIRR